ncbi:MAG: hypothetical protein WCF44_18645 [Candidatus Methylophosphatis roskildensis]
MSTTFALLVGFLVLAILAYRQRHRWKRREENWGGEAMRGKRLIFSERLFRSSRTGIVAKIDRGYLAEGLIHLLEFKTRRRHRIYPADIIELSAQRVAVQGDDGRPVADAGYVLTENERDGSRLLHEVRLLPEDALLRLRDRRAMILDGRLPPREACAPGLCKACAYREECKE